MSRQAAVPESARNLLSWEDLGAQPAGRAFRRSLAELLRRPGAFFRKMALTGGLHEPVAFFAIVLGAVIVLAFPAALAYFVLMQPDPARMAPEVYARYVLAAQGTGLALVLLPVALAAGAGAMVLLGTLFHLAGKPFGARNWEGSAQRLALLGLGGAGAAGGGAGAAAGRQPGRLPARAAAGGGALDAAGRHGRGAGGGRGAAAGPDDGGLRGGVRAGAGAGRGGGVCRVRGGGGGGMRVGGLALGWPGAWCAFALAGLAVAALRRGGE